MFCYVGPRCTSSTLAPFSTTTKTYDWLYQNDQSGQNSKNDFYTLVNSALLHRSQIGLLLDIPFSYESLFRNTKPIPDITTTIKVDSQYIGW